MPTVERHRPIASRVERETICNELASMVDRLTARPCLRCGAAIDDPLTRPCEGCRDLRDVWRRAIGMLRGLRETAA